MTGNDDRESDTKDRRQRTKRIGRHLRQIYDDVAQEDVPKEFLDLLEQADRGSPSQKRVG